MRDTVNMIVIMLFATVQVLNRDSHLYKYEKDAFDCIILDEAHYLYPFHYSGITDLSMVEDRKKLSPEEFRSLTSVRKVK